MLTLYHSPRSRSTRILALLHELDALDAVRTEIVEIRRRDGSGAPDAGNPHPEGKVPLLVHDGVAVRESPAIVQYLAELFPANALAPLLGEPKRGAYLAWLAYYGSVMEPVMVTEAVGLRHPALEATFRGGDEMRACLAGALEHSPFLLGERFTSSDLLLHSPYAWFGQPGVPAIDAWVERCMSRPSFAFARDFDDRHAQG